MPTHSMRSTAALRLTAAIAATTVLAACGGGSSMTPPPAATANVAMLISDASTEDWSTIGVKVLSIALVPQGGGASVTVYTAPATPPMVNLAELDQIAEILGNATVPAGTYTGATLTVSGNPGDIELTVSPNPEPGFAAAAGTTIPAAQIQVQGTQGSAPNLTVPVNLGFVAPLVVTAGQNNALDLEFDLAHPAFLVGHVPPGAGTVLWAVNFDGPVRQRPVHDLARLVLRHMYGAVTAIATDNSSITINREFPTRPIVSPETATSTSASYTIMADATNGTLYYDVDAHTHALIKDFSAEPSLVGKSVRVAARYQQDGTLVATRIWASSSFNSVWLSPEGHVLHVDDSNDVITVANEQGQAVPLTVDANTQFYFRQPQNPAADVMPIGTGPAFLTAGNLVRGFKVHVGVVDPLATPLVAQTVDIETADYGGAISGAGTAGFTYTRSFADTTDDYTHALPFISSSTPNGSDPSGNALTGFKWWNFAYPTLLDSGANAVADFTTAVGGAVNFGGTVGAVTAHGASYAVWGDPAAPGGWAAPDAIVTPTRLPLGMVATPLANGAFSMTVAGGVTAVTVDVSSTAGSATLVYQVDRTNGVVSISSVDIATSSGLNSLTAALTAGTPVKVYGVPQADGTLKAYVLNYFTGVAPTE